jgi:type VII secretion-associated serine protease mycosin
VTGLRVGIGRVLLTAALGVALVAAATSGAGASDDPLSGRGATLQRAAAAILATAEPGEPLKVVTTSRTAGAPTIVTEVAASRVEALDVITAGLARASTIGVDMMHPVSIAATNDSYRSRQWALDRLAAESSWRTSTGRGTIVAVVDTGVWAGHPDLRGHVLAGRDLVSPGTTANDQNGHGTHVAGIVAAVAGNRRGIAGLARDARILPVRVLGSSGAGESAAVARGIVWAVDHGADVINLSLSTTQADSANRAAVSYAISKNVVVVAAAGNDGCGLLGSPRAYPAAYPGVLGVGAITSKGAVSSFSSCGDWVDVVAPGTGVVSTMTVKPNNRLGCASYCTLSGTSMASPYAAAAAALEIQRLGPGWAESRVRSIIQSTADDIGWGGRDNQSGYGVIHPRRMLAAR